MIKWFINNLKPSYYERMINAQVTHFANLIPIWECIDKGIRSKKIVDPDALHSMIEQQVKKATNRKGKEVDVHMIARTPKRPKGSTSIYATPIVQPYLQQVQPAQALHRAFNQRGRPDQPQYPKREPWKFPLLPMPMLELYPYLLEKKLVNPLFVRPRDGLPPHGFDPSKKCEHYFGAKGHTLKECVPL